MSSSGLFDNPFGGGGGISFENIIPESENFEFGSDLSDQGDPKRWIKDLFGVDDPKKDIPAVEPAPTVTDIGDPITKHVKPEIALALSDFEARRAMRRGRGATQVTTPGSLMEPNISRPSLRDEL